MICKSSPSCSLCYHLLKHAWSSSSSSGRVCSFVSLVGKTERSMTLPKYLPLPTSQGLQNERQPYWNPASGWFFVSNINWRGRRNTLTRCFVFIYVIVTEHNTYSILARSKTDFNWRCFTFLLDFLPGLRWEPNIWIHFAFHKFGCAFVSQQLNKELQMSSKKLKILNYQI